MKWRDLKISRQLNLALGIILTFVVLVGGLNLYKSDQLWQSTKDLYEHPFTVQQAIAAAEADILEIRLNMKEMVIAGTPEKSSKYVASIDLIEADLLNQMAVLKALYLGPATDITTAAGDITTWKSIRDESIRLFHDGKIAEAVAQVEFDGVFGIQSAKVMNDFQAIHTFAKDKAEEFYTNAQTSKNKSVVQMMILLAIALIFTIVFSMFLRRGILSPVKELTNATTEFQQGRLSARSRYLSHNEFGALSNIFNKMTETVQNEIQSKENHAEVSSVMFHQETLPSLCTHLLEIFMKHTNSQAGSFYMFNKDTSLFEPFESIGMKKDSEKPFSAQWKEGEFGIPLLTKKIHHIKDIPEDSTMTFSTTAGDFKPKEILTIPVLKDGEIVMILSLTSIHNYTPQAIQLVNGIHNEMSTRISSIMNAQKVFDFSQKLQNTNTELQQQAKELAMQTDELTEQNIELEMQKKQLDEASRLKSSFLSNMSHELRTPLNSVIALSSVLNRRLNGMIPLEEYSYLDVIERNGKNLLALVNDLLDLSRLEAGKEEILNRSFHITNTIDDILEMLNVQAVNKGVALVNEMPSDLPGIISDEGKCRHIFQNLIGNAIKFTDHGTIRITARLCDQEMEISIQDTGIGIDPKHLDFIFDEFRQADESASRRNGGTGLGLAIVKKYTHLLGGTITVESEPGIGSIFHVTLPMSPGRTQATGTNEGFDFLRKNKMPIHRELPKGEAKKILLVDDSEPAIIQTKDILTEQGYHVLVARSGKEAIEQIEKTRPDGMILDLMMPEMDGFEVLKAVRDVEENERIPVLILSAKHITKDELSFLRTNHVSQLIQKGSIDKNALLEAVEYLVYEKHLDRDAKHPAVMEKLDEKSMKTANTREKLKQSFRNNDRRAVILIVEDNPDNMITVKALLGEDFDILEATDGKQGVDMAVRMIPDLILMDISLPEMDGFQALTKIRSENSLDGTPVIALTARAMSGDMNEIISHGFDGYVSKPIDEENLKEIIWRQLNDE